MFLFKLKITNFSARTGRNGNFQPYRARIRFSIIYYPQKLSLDKGYDSDEVRGFLSEFGIEAHIRARGEEAQAIKRSARFKARRWVVERTHSWMNRFRRILTRWEKKAANYIAFLHLACAIITWRSVWSLQG